MLLDRKKYWTKVKNHNDEKYNDYYCCICFGPWFVTNLRIVYSVNGNKPMFVCNDGCTDESDDRFIEIGNY